MPQVQVMGVLLVGRCVVGEEISQRVADLASSSQQDQWSVC